MEKTLTQDQWLAALCLFREAQNQPKAAKEAVYAVLLNRQHDRQVRWPTNLSDVVTQPLQFSSFNHSDPNSAKFPRRINRIEWAAWLECVDVVSDLNALNHDPTSGATNYHDKSIAPPVLDFLGPHGTLAQLLAKKTCDVGAFSFYKL